MLPRVKKNNVCNNVIMCEQFDYSQQTQKSTTQTVAETEWTDWPREEREGGCHRAAGWSMRCRRNQVELNSLSHPSSLPPGLLQLKTCVSNIQLLAIVQAEKCPKMDILLQQVAESYLLAHASLSKLMQPMIVDDDRWRDMMMVAIKMMDNNDSGCIKCEFALHGLAAYLLNGLQQCSSLQSRRKQRWRLLILILRKITT